jgi:hypothetical protein
VQDEGRPGGECAVMDRTKREPMADEALTMVLDYHERTKHHPHRYAASLGYLDWANQPDPFRTYAGAAVTPLPLTAAALEARYEALYTPGAIDPQGLTLE